MLKVLDLDGYYPLVSPITGIQTCDMERSDARIVHKDIIDHLPERLVVLRKLCERNGLTNDPEGWTHLIDQIERDPDSPGDWAIEWWSIGFDIALAMGEDLIERSNGQLFWKLYTGSTRSLSFQHSVLFGFKNVDNRTTSSTSTRQ